MQLETMKAELSTALSAAGRYSLRGGKTQGSAHVNGAFPTNHTPQNN